MESTECLATLVDRFRSHVRQHPDAPAVSDFERSLTYAELDELSDRVARALLASRPEPGSRVCMMFGQAVGGIVGTLGSVKAGLCLVPLNAHENDEFLGTLWLETEPIAILADRRYAGRAKEICGDGDQVICPDALPESSSPVAKPLPSPTDRDEVMAIIYTSGSTGRPKGVMTTTRCVLERVRQYRETTDAGPGDCQAIITPWHFAGSLAGVYGSLLSGAHLCLYDAHTNGIDGLTGWIRDQGVNLLQLPVAILRRLLANGEFGSIPNVRMASVSGDRLPRAEAVSLLERMAPGALLEHAFGCTETNMATKLELRLPTDDWPADSETRVLTTGFPVAGKVIRILDEQGNPIEGGGFGRIAVESEFLSAGYWNQPEQTKQSFGIGPNGRRFYLMGDFGRIRSDGCLEVSGRLGTHVKVRGMRVAVTAVESAILSLPRVASVAVTPHKASADDSYLVAHLEARKGDNLNTSQLRRSLQRKIPAHWIPARFVILDSMPLTPSGKIDRQALPDPGTSRPELDAPYVAPRNADEKLVAEFWGDLLKLDAVGAHDEFFDLGGDSMSLLEMLTALEVRTDIPLPLEDLDGIPTPARVAEALALYRARDISSSQVMSPEAQRELRRERDPDRPPLYRFKRAIKDPVRHIAPMLFGMPLPHAPGIRLRRWLTKRCTNVWPYSRPLSDVRLWHERLDITTSLEEALQRSLMANTWRHWRERALDGDASPRQTVSIEGQEYLDAAVTQRRGIVLVMTHVTFNAFLRRIPSIAGREFFQVRNAKGRHFGGRPDAAATERTQQLQFAMETLRADGIVLIAGDGGQGPAAVELPLHGTTRRFQPGAATLAETTGAAMLPVFGMIRTDDTIVFRFCKSLVSEADNPENRITDQTRQYGGLFAKEWPNIYDSLTWKSLTRALHPPPHW